VEGVVCLLVYCGTEVASACASDGNLGNRSGVVRRLAEDMPVQGFFCVIDSQCVAISATNANVTV
jgi:hypothetical protein